MKMFNKYMNKTVLHCMQLYFSVTFFFKSIMALYKKRKKHLTSSPAKVSLVQSFRNSTDSCAFSGDIEGGNKPCLLTIGGRERKQGERREKNQSNTAELSDHMR